MKKSLDDIATRLANGENSFLATLVEIGGITNDDAKIVLRVWRKLRVVKKQSISDGRITVKHGAFMSRDVILRTLEQGKRGA